MGCTCLGCQDSPTPKGKPLHLRRRGSEGRSDDAQVPLDTVTSCNTNRLLSEVPLPALSNSANIQSIDMRLGLNPVPLEAPADVTASLSVPDTEVPTLGKVQTKPPPSLKPGLAPTSALDQLDLEPIEFLSVASK